MSVEVCFGLGGLQPVKRPYVKLPIVGFGQLLSFDCMLVAIKTLDGGSEEATITKTDKQSNIAKNYEQIC